MSHYVHYWKPERASLAFDGIDVPLRSLENGWFKILKPGDVLWILTRATNGHVVLVLRGTVATVSKERRHPAYAVGNSLFSHHLEFVDFLTIIVVENARGSYNPSEEADFSTHDIDITRLF